MKTYLKPEHVLVAGLLILLAGWLIDYGGPVMWVGTAIVLSSVGWKLTARMKD